MARDDPPVVKFIVDVLVPAAMIGAIIVLLRLHGVRIASQEDERGRHQ